MPRVVPSQVRDFIAGIHLPQHAVVRINDVGPHVLSALLDLVEQIPNELFTMDSKAYELLILAKATIKDILATWRANQNANQKLRDFTFRRSDDPLARISNALAMCPDESPAPSTSEISFVTDADLRTNLRNDIGAINLALSNGEWKAATVLAGSAIEALLLWALQQRQQVDITSALASLRTAGTLTGKQASGPLEEWHLHEYIEVAIQLGIIKKETAIQSRLAKDFRNLIHPGRAQRLGQESNRGTALSSVAALEHVVRDLS